jgi:hypothetical protein
MRINDNHPCPCSVELGQLSAQLRELSVADGSRVTVDEHEDDGLLSSEIAQAHVPSGE